MLNGTENQELIVPHKCDTRVWTGSGTRLSQFSICCESVRSFLIKIAFFFHFQPPNVYFRLKDEYYEIHKLHIQKTFITQIEAVFHTLKIDLFEPKRK